MRWCIILLIGSASSLWAQRSDPFTLQLQNLYSGEAINVFDLRSQEMEGSLYWNEEWTNGAIKLRNGGKVDAFPLRYDLMGQGLEIFLGNDVKLLPASAIAEFYLEQNGQLYHFVDVGIYFGFEGFTDGFYEVLEKGSCSLLRRSEVEILKPNYVPALDAGNPNQTAVRKDQFYFYYQGQLIRLPGQKQKAIRQLQPYFPEIERWVADGKTRFKKAGPLQLLLHKINSSLENPEK